MADSLGVTVKNLLDAMVDGDEEDWNAVLKIAVPEHSKQRPPHWSTPEEERGTA